MASVLLLTHRLPYPPNKGDKIHTYHLLAHLARRHRVLLGTFVDDPADEAYVERVRSLCEQLHVSRLSRNAAQLRSLSGLLSGLPLSVAFYRDHSLAAWVEALRRQGAVDWLVIYSSSMLQYAAGFERPMLIDFADVDSAKWSACAERHRWPMSWVYRREGRCLLEVERAGAARARWSLFATENEAELFRRAVPEVASRVSVLGNGVDSQYFAPAADRDNPYRTDEVPIVFMGAMDYWPNVDAVTWFVQEILPRLLERHPRARFHIVGRYPTAAVRALASQDVNVTGSVEDVRPFVQHAAVVVAPLRLARGIQNKVLEAMSLARPVVAAAPCVEAIDAESGVHLLGADTTAEYVDAIDKLLRDRGWADAIGRAGRERVMAAYSWDARLADLERFMS